MLLINTNPGHRSIFFIGLPALKMALPKSGQMMKEYPIKEPNYFEGHIKLHWVDNNLIYIDFSQSPLYTIQYIGKK